jgi:hypothetical protein
VNRGPVRRMELVGSSQIVYAVLNGTMGGACSKYGGEERRIQGFGGET